MKTYLASEIRNFSVVGHGGSGKTMLCEAMLACSGVVSRLGSIAAGTTQSDYHPDEKAHQISIHPTLLHTEWLDRKFNIIDCPGYLDFLAGALGAIRASDFALIVVNAANGVEVGTDQVWEYATRFGLPKIIVVNDLDKEHANFDAILAELREHFGQKMFPMTLPMNPGPGFNQLLDVMRSEAVSYATDGSGKYEEKPAEGDWNTRVRDLHRELIELTAEADDSLLERFFEQDGLSEEELRAGVHKAVQSEAFVPVFCTSAQHDIGVMRLMDFIAKYASSPADRKVVPALDREDRPIDIALADTETAAWVFNTSNEAHVGGISVFRVYSGSIRAGTGLINANTGSEEKLTQLFVLNGKNRVPVDRLDAGDIGAVVKLRNTFTGNTLCSPGRFARLPAIEYPPPNFQTALVLKNKGDEDRLAQGLLSLHAEDPTFRHRVDPETHQTLLSGQGEMHIQILAEALRDNFNVAIDMAEPRVPLRETIKARAETKYRHKKQSGGAGQFAEVWLRIEPGPRNSGVDFKHSLVGQNVDRAFVPSVEKGVKTACHEGVLAGYQVVDLKVDFYDGKMHPVDSKDIAFQIAGNHAFRDAFLNAKPYLLEPIYDLEIKVPDKFTGDVIADLSARRGHILGMDTAGSLQVIKAAVPQLELYRYSSALRAISGGRGIHSEKFSRYEEMPSSFQEKFISKARSEKAH